ncbi:MAG: response regulator [Pseudomonadota bacterium]|nr:response regulator [Sphingobium naphthae]MEC7931640.1 response regulator [Pseudomonadota bacterium]MEE2742205.1 response regulator [Pseudomonadota bacterium]|tara:strand:+ start:2069 stop:2665 length:597 start_codon:yes stop_codon:yes gene_type:complete
MSGSDCGIIHVVDDDADLGKAVARLLGRHGYRSCAFETPVAMLAHQSIESAHCLITDVMMAQMDGFAFAEQMRARDPAMAIIFMTAWPTTANAVDAVRRYGGLDYLEKPLDEERLLHAVNEAARWSQARRYALERLAPLTPREREVLACLAQGLSNKMVAGELGLSPKTVEDHRAAIIAKTGATSAAALIALIREAEA